MNGGMTFDTGMLIALERRSDRARKVVQLASETRIRITVPAAVVAEWWRGRSDRRESILGAVHVEPLADRVARAAGEALAAVRGSATVDAIVMASAAQRGDAVYTSDIDDLQKLASYFRAVRILGVG
jgi:predicted nucleic acid-binding protein